MTECAIPHCAFWFIHNEDIHTDADLVMAMELAELLVLDDDQYLPKDGMYTDQWLLEAVLAALKARLR